jgi:hypothetical protein
VRQGDLPGPVRPGRFSSQFCVFTALLPPCGGIMVWLLGPRRITRRVAGDDPPSWVMVAVELPWVLVVVDTPVDVSAVLATVQPARASRMPSMARWCGFIGASFGASL